MLLRADEHLEPARHGGDGRLVLGLEVGGDRLAYQTHGNVVGLGSAVGPALVEVARARGGGRLRAGDRHAVDGALVGHDRLGRGVGHAVDEDLEVGRGAAAGLDGHGEGEFAFRRIVDAAIGAHVDAVAVRLQLIAHGVAGVARVHAGAGDRVVDPRQRVHGTAVGEGLVEAAADRLHVVVAALPGIVGVVARRAAVVPRAGVGEEGILVGVVAAVGHAGGNATLDAAVGQVEGRAGAERDLGAVVSHVAPEDGVLARGARGARSGVFHRAAVGVGARGDDGGVVAEGVVHQGWPGVGALDRAAVRAGRAVRHSDVALEDVVPQGGARHALEVDAAAVGVVARAVAGRVATEEVVVDVGRRGVHDRHGAAHAASKVALEVVVVHLRRHAGSAVHGAAASLRRESPVAGKVIPADDAVGPGAQRDGAAHRDGEAVGLIAVEDVAGDAEIAPKGVDRAAPAGAAGRVGRAVAEGVAGDLGGRVCAVDGAAVGVTYRRGGEVVVELVAGDGGRGVQDADGTAVGEGLRDAAGRCVVGEPVVGDGGAVGARREVVDHDRAAAVADVVATLDREAVHDGGRGLVVLEEEGAVGVGSAAAAVDDAGRRVAGIALNHDALAAEVHIAVLVARDRLARGVVGPVGHVHRVAGRRGHHAFADRAEGAGRGAVLDARGVVVVHVQVVGVRDGEGHGGALRAHGVDDLDLPRTDGGADGDAEINLRVRPAQDRPVDLPAAQEDHAALGGAEVAAREDALGEGRAAVGVDLRDHRRLRPIGRRGRGDALHIVDALDEAPVAREGHHAGLVGGHTEGVGKAERRRGHGLAEVAPVHELEPVCVVGDDGELAGVCHRDVLPAGWEVLDEGEGIERLVVRDVDRHIEVLAGRVCRGMRPRHANRGEKGLDAVWLHLIAIAGLRRRRPADRRERLRGRLGHLARGVRDEVAKQDGPPPYRHVTWLWGGLGDLPGRLDDEVGKQLVSAVVLRLVAARAGREAVGLGGVHVVLAAVVELDRAHDLEEVDHPVGSGAPVVAVVRARVVGARAGIEAVEPGGVHVVLAAVVEHDHAHDFEQIDHPVGPAAAVVAIVRRRVGGRGVDGIAVVEVVPVGVEVAAGLARLAVDGLHADVVVGGVGQRDRLAEGIGRGGDLAARLDRRVREGRLVVALDDVAGVGGVAVGAPRDLDRLACHGAHGPAVGRVGEGVDGDGGGGPGGLVVELVASLDGVGVGGVHAEAVEGKVAARLPDRLTARAVGVHAVLDLVGGRDVVVGLGRGHLDAGRARGVGHRRPGHRVGCRCLGGEHLDDEVGDRDLVVVGLLLGVEVVGDQRELLVVVGEREGVGGGVAARVDAGVVDGDVGKCPCAALRRARLGLRRVPAHGPVVYMVVRLELLVPPRALGDRADVRLRRPRPVGRVLHPKGEDPEIGRAGDDGVEPELRAALLHDDGRPGRPEVARHSRRLPRRGAAQREQRQHHGHPEAEGTTAHHRITSTKELLPRGRVCEPCVHRSARS